MFLIKIRMSLFSYLNAESWRQSLLWNILLHLFFWDTDSIDRWDHIRLTLKPLTSIILMFILVFTWYHKGMSRLVGCVLLICLLALTEVCLITVWTIKKTYGISGILLNLPWTLLLPAVVLSLQYFLILVILIYLFQICMIYSFYPMHT